MPFPLLRSAAALALMGLSATALADTRIELDAGSSHSDHAWSKTAWVGAVFKDRNIGQTQFTWAPAVSLGYIEGRNAARCGHGMADDIWMLAGGVRFHYGNDSHWYHHLFWTSQIAAVAGRTWALSSGGEFVNSVGWQGEHWTIQVRHASNAGMKEPNRGETMALVGVAFNL